MALKICELSILLLSCLALLAGAFEENNNFCIRTEPLFLSDMEKHVNPPEGDPNCGVLATTLTIKEKESLLHTLCEDHGSSHKDDYQFFKLHNGELAGRASFHEICGGKANPLLAWVPYEMFRTNFAQELNPKERLNYIAKASDVDREKTELCHFRHSDLVTNISANLFTCIVMIFEDNFYGLDSNINVLVEIQPLMYELRNISYMPWINTTASYKTLLGRTALKNPSREAKPIYGSISYAYVEKVRLNGSSVYSENMRKLPLLFEHKGSVLELDENGVGGVDVKEKAYFGRSMDPKTTVEVDVIGQWAENRKQFTAEIYEYFGYGIKRFRNEMHNGAVSFVRIESSEPVYEKPESTLLTKPSVHVTGKKDDQFERLTDGKSSAEKAAALEDFEDTRGGSPYPGFYPWSVVGALIVGVVLLAAVIGMLRSCSSKTKEKKQKYKFSGI